MKLSRKMLNRNAGCLLVVLSLLGMTSCGADKKGSTSPDESTVETLDNLASDDDFTKNQCRPFGDAGERKVILKEENITFKGVSTMSQEVIKDEVYTVMSNIPQSVLTVFFALDGKVEVNTNTSAICRKLLNSRTEQDASQYTEDDKLVSCWSRDDDGSATIYVDPATESRNGKEYSLGIHHSLIRSFGYVLSEMFLSLDIQVEDDDFQTWNVKELEKPTDADQQMLEDLAEAFIADVEASNGKYELDEYKKLIEGTEAQQQKFRYFVFAEAFDSYHCSEDTRALISTDFPETAKVMGAVAKTLSKLEEATESEVNVDDDSSSLMLTNNDKGSRYDNNCNCFKSSFGGILSGIFGGIRNIVVGVAHVIKTIVVTVVSAVFKIIAIPFKFVFGVIKCIFTPLRAGIRIGTTPIRHGHTYQTPLQHPCQTPGQKSCQADSPNQNDGGVKVDKKKTATTTVKSDTKTDAGTVADAGTKKAKPAEEATSKKKKKKKWYQCGTVGEAGENGLASTGMLLLMLAPLFAVFLRKEENA